MRRHVLRAAGLAVAAAALSIASPAIAQAHAATGHVASKPSDGDDYRRCVQAGLNFGMPADQVFKSCMYALDR